MKKDKFYKLLEEFEKLGLNLFNKLNADIDKLIAEAQEHNIIIPDYVAERNYILGSVLANTEWLGNVPFNTLFFALEHHISLYEVDATTQKKLHETLDSFYNYNDDRYVLSKNVLKELKNVCGKQYKDYFNRVAETYHYFMKDIVEELEELLYDIKLDNDLI